MTQKYNQQVGLHAHKEYLIHFYQECYIIVTIPVNLNKFEHFDSKVKYPEKPKIDTFQVFVDFLKPRFSKLLCTALLRANNLKFCPYTNFCMQGTPMSSLLSGLTRLH